MSAGYGVGGSRTGAHEDTGAVDADLVESGWSETARPPALEPAVARAHRIVADDLYGAIPVSRWAQSLLDHPIFRRLDAVSLSDVPGSILFGRPFPSRLAHSLGVYYLARQARPRDRALQVAALAHDLGHGPFSHLIEPLMIERLGIDHETRSARLLRSMMATVRGPAARLLAWLDIGEVTELIMGAGSDQRGALLNGSLDYDNLDNVARFAVAGHLHIPTYDAKSLARALRIERGHDGAACLVLSDEALGDAIAWQSERAAVYRFLQTDDWNIAAHGMLRKAIDLLARAGALSDSFFEETDEGALRILRAHPATRALTEHVLAHDPYGVIWEGSAPPKGERVGRVFARWTERLSLEGRIAAESGLRPEDVVTTHLTSQEMRDLPPTVSRVAGGVALAPRRAPSEQRVMLLTPAGIGRDYVRRARMAAERAFGELGATTRGWPELR